MNYIKKTEKDIYAIANELRIAKLKAENEQLKKGIEESIAELIEYQKYYNSPKFEGTENDYAHIKTDVYVKITTIKMYLQHTLNTTL